MDNSIEELLTRVSDGVSKIVKRAPADYFEPNEVTIVTGLFDINKHLAGSQQRRTVEEYLELGRDMLEMDRNLVICTEPHIAPRIWKIRKDLGLLDKTYIITLSLDDSPYNRYLDIYKSRCRAKSLESHPYYVITWTKFYALREACIRNPFESKGVWWLDFGIKHLYTDPVLRKDVSKFNVRLIRTLASLRKETLTLPIINLLSPDNLADFDSYTCDHKTMLAAGIFGGPIDLMIPFIDHFDETLLKCSLLGHIVLEEQLMYTYFNEYPERVSPIFCSYTDILEANPVYTGSSVYLLNQHLTTHRQKVNNYYVLIVGAYILQSLVNNNECFSPQTTLIFIDEIALAVFHGIKGTHVENRDSLIKDIGELMNQYLEKFPSLQTDPGMDRARRNLKYYH